MELLILISPSLSCFFLSALSSLSLSLISVSVSLRYVCPFSLRYVFLSVFLCALRLLSPSLSFSLTYRHPVVYGVVYHQNQRPDPHKVTAPGEVEQRYGYQMVDHHFFKVLPSQTKACHHQYSTVQLLFLLTTATIFTDCNLKVE